MTFRYLELIHPLWHKAHFKIKWVYVTMVGCWCFGIGLNASYMIPTTKVNKNCAINNIHHPTFLFLNGKKTRVLYIVITDRIRRMGGGNVFSLFTGGEGYPKVPTPCSGQGTYAPPQDNRWSTWYAAVGMPLAFTQEDFLVNNRNTKMQ